MPWTTDHRFSDPLIDLRAERDQAEAAALLVEVERELSPTHVLHGVVARVVARAIPQDDVVVETKDDRVALVHLTWSGRPEQPPWPTTETLESAEALERFVEFHY